MRLDSRPTEHFTTVKYRAVSSADPTRPRIYAIEQTVGRPGSDRQGLSWRDSA